MSPMDFLNNMLTGPLALAAGFALVAFGALRLRRLTSKDAGERKSD
jgi:hypothetical protein